MANLTPSPYGLAGQAGLRALRAGELEVYYTRESTTLPQGPSRSMYDCFIRQVRGHGWTPDHGMNTAGKKSAAHGRLVFFFYDSGSRFKAGNELSVGWTPASRTHGQGAVLGVSIDPNQHLPDLPPPPK